MFLKIANNKEEKHIKLLLSGFGQIQKTSSEATPVKRPSLGGEVPIFYIAFFNPDFMFQNYTELLRLSLINKNGTRMD